MSVTGIIHVGAHFGEEYQEYIANGVKKVIFIEPCKKAFEQLVRTAGMHPGVICINKACGIFKDTLMMYTETANKGQSNSLLRPDLHLMQYPSIEFTGREEVAVDTLDNIIQELCIEALDDFSPFNLLVMDVQGYEDRALHGAKAILHNIDYVYTEVNQAELYEDCAQVQQIDALLTDFDRVITNWAGKTWGDALYIRKSLNR
jgi:FkbM family methyltransferase